MSQPQHCQPFKKLPKEVREDTILYHGSLQRHDSNEDLLDNFFGSLPLVHAHRLMGILCRVSSMDLFLSITPEYGPS